MKPTPTSIPEVLLIEPVVHGDERGYFLESWTRRDFAAAGVAERFVQDNHSFSRRGILRGLHYQLERPQGKLVRVIGGRVFDVAVDLRKSSPTFGKWVSAWLSEDDHQMLWVPPGFAHGFYVASESAHFLYKCTDYYSPEDERTLLWSDPALAIDWPLESSWPPIVSKKDQKGVPFAAAECYP
jgi:dTDP-4-dehydrorhamnose 3,5-epimerase